MNKMEVKKTVREGISESRTSMMSLLLQQKEVKDVIDSLCHKMRKVVLESRFQYLDRLVEKSDDPMHYPSKKRIGFGGPLQELQLREFARFYGRLRFLKDEYEGLQRHYDEAIQDLFFVLEES